MGRGSLKVSSEGIKISKEALKYCGLTQKALGEEIGISRSTISKFFNCKYVDRWVFEEICHRLNLNWQEIFEKPAPNLDTESQLDISEKQGSYKDFSQYDSSWVSREKQMVEPSQNLRNFGMTFTNKVFISYSSKDKAFVRRLSSDLQSNSMYIWLDEIELKVGDSLRQKIEQGIEQSKWVLVVLSQNSVNSPWVQQELNAAFALELSLKKVFILPAIIDDCRIPLFMKDKVYADFRTSYNVGLNALINRFGGETYSRGQLVYSSIEEGFSKWTLYNTNGVSSTSIKEISINGGKKGYYLRSFEKEDVGLCLSVRSLCGSAIFYYKVIRGEPSYQNIYFAMIPMQETGFSRSGYIEVGTDYQDDPKNTTSNYRQRYFIPPEHYLSDQWHRGLLEFDFRDTPIAFYSIFAPRINEGCSKKGSVEFIISEVYIYGV